MKSSHVLAASKDTECCAFLMLSSVPVAQQAFEDFHVRSQPVTLWVVVLVRSTFLVLERRDINYHFF